jgi:uncharacterized SAM-binding protein YcdF (DUF218 family)
VFAQTAIDMGVPADVILIENKSQNTGQNYDFAMSLLREKGVELKRLIVVHKPFVERRAYATGKIWLPDSVELIVTSPNLSIEEYPNESNSIDNQWIHGMVGSVQRMKEYPAKGFQIHQDIPGDIWQAYEYLVAAGYTKSLIK